MLALPEETRAIIYCSLNVDSAVALWLTCRGAITHGWICSEKSRRPHAGDCDCNQNRFRRFTFTVYPVRDRESTETSLCRLTQCDDSAYTRQRYNGQTLYSIKIQSYPRCKLEIQVLGSFRCTLTNRTRMSRFPRCAGEISGGQTREIRLSFEVSEHAQIRSSELPTVFADTNLRIVSSDGAPCAWTRHCKPQSTLIDVFRFIKNYL